MAALVENMFYVREKPWHGIGTRVEEAPDSKKALELAGLAWNVAQVDVHVNGDVVPGYKANMRDSDNKILGIVSDKYKVVQNVDAFAFTDSLIGDDVRYETAGSLCGGKKVWLLARLPSTKIVGDEVAPYLCFTNTHDGTGAIRVCVTPVRVVCNNTLNVALRSAKRSWAVKHVGNVSDKILEASETLGLANDYLENLKVQADVFANTSIDRDELNEILNELFPVKSDATDREKASISKMKDEFMVAYYMPDLNNFRGTAWGVINAASDMATHCAPRRNTKDYKANNWNRVLNGHAIIDAAVASCMKRV